MKKGLILIIILILYVLSDFIFYKVLNHIYNSNSPYQSYFRSINKKKDLQVKNYIFLYLLNTFAIFYLCILKNPFLHFILRFLHNILVGIIIYSIHSLYLMNNYNYPSQLALFDILFNALSYPIISLITVTLINI